jgi:hypothetical protein
MSLGLAPAKSSWNSKLKALPAEKSLFQPMLLTVTVFVLLVDETGFAVQH